jgi:hypothetical protein
MDAPRPRCDAERHGRHSHAEHGNDQGKVRHLIAGRLSDLSSLLDGISVRSRDFR